MSFDWHDYFKLAQDLHQSAATDNPREEALLRAAVSRAYYGLFCATRNYLITTQPANTIPVTAEAHARVQRTCEANANRDLRFIGIKLGRLRWQRNKVDYDDQVPGLSAMTTQAIVDTKQAFVRLQQLSDSSV